MDRVVQEGSSEMTWSRNLNAMSKQDREISRGKDFQTEVIGNTKTLRWE